MSKFSGDGWRELSPAGQGHGKGQFRDRQRLKALIWLPGQQVLAEIPTAQEYSNTRPWVRHKAEETQQSLLAPLAQVEDGVSRTLWD